MQNTKALFDLIKAMSPTEKRYFKLSSTLHGRKDKLYLELFDTINRMDSYDKEEIEEYFGQAKFVKYLAAGKYHLYNRILKCLRGFYSESSRQLTLDELLIDSQILSQKKLRKQAIERLNQAAELAKRYHLDIDHLRIIYEQKKIIRLNPSRENETLLVKLQSESVFLQRRIEREIIILRIYERVLWYNQTGEQLKRKKWVNVAYKKLALVDPESLSLSFRALLCYYYLLSVALQQRGDIDEVGSQYKKIIDMYDRNRHMIAEFLPQYINTIKNYIDVCINTKNFDQIPELIKNLESIKINNNASLKLQIEYYRYSSLFIYYLNVSKFQEAINIVIPLESLINNPKISIDLGSKLTYDYNIAVAYFMQFVLNPNDSSERTFLLDKALNKTFQLTSDSLKEHNQIYLKSCIIYALASLENGIFLPAKSKIESAETKAKSNSLERKVIKLLKSYIETFLTNNISHRKRITTKLKRFEPSSFIESWMEELALWISEKANS